MRQRPSRLINQSNNQSPEDPPRVADLTSLDAGTFKEAKCDAKPKAGQNCTPPGTAFNFLNTTANSSPVTITVRENFHNFSPDLTPNTEVITFQFAG